VVSTGGKGMRLCGGYTNYGQDIGILMMDTVFPRIVGDIGNANTFDIHVRYRTVRNLPTTGITEENFEKLMITPFLEAAKHLEEEGCKAITTSCSFLAGFQRQLADAVHIPVFTTPMLLVPMIHTMLNKNLEIGIFTEKAEVLSEEFFRQAGFSTKDIPVCVSGMPEDSEFARLFIGNHMQEDLNILEDCISEMTEKHMKEHPKTGAIVLECANFSPFSGIIQKIAGVPVFGMNQLLEYIHACVNVPDYIRR